MNFTFQADLLALPSSLKWRVSEVQRFKDASGHMLLLALRHVRLGWVYKRGKSLYHCTFHWNICCTSGGTINFINQNLKEIAESLGFHFVEVYIILTANCIW